jgi:hypothetical protein
MRRSLLVLALAMGGVLMLGAPAWAPPLYGLQIRPIRGEYDHRAIVRTVEFSASAAVPTERQQPYFDVLAGTTLVAEGSYDFGGTLLDGQDNPTRNGVEERCAAGNFVVLTSQRVQMPPPEGVPEDALAVPVVKEIMAGNPPTFELELATVEDAWGEYYLRVRCVEEQDLQQQGIQGAPQEEELERLDEFLDSSEGQRGPFKPFRNFGTNLYVVAKEG